MSSEPLKSAIDLSIDCQDLAACQRLARVLAGQLKAGQAVLLDGALGAGKTTFISMLCESLGIAQQASSPTYTISNLYDAPDFSIFHIDAYRMTGPKDFYLLGLDEYFDEALLLIEWGQRVEQLFPQALRIFIDMPESGTEARQFQVSAPHQSWASCLKILEGEA